MGYIENVQTWIDQHPWWYSGVLAGVLFVAWLIRERQRKRALQRLAADLGLSFDAQSSPLVTYWLDGLELVNKKWRGKSSNLIYGKRGDGEIVVFDWRFEPSLNPLKESETIEQTVVSIIIPGLALTPFSLRPEKLQDKMGKWFKLQDFGFEDDPEFCKAYVVQGPNESAIRDTLDGAIREMLHPYRKLTLEAEGERLVIYRYGQLAEPPQVRSLMSLIERLGQQLARQSGPIS